MRLLADVFGSLRSFTNRYARALTRSAIVIAALLVTVLGPWIAPYDAEAPIPGAILLPPPDVGQLPGLVWGSITGSNSEPPHWFGTDAVGFDIFSRVILGLRVDLFIGLSVTAIAFLLGTALGLVTGYVRGWLVDGMVRVSDVVQSFPIFILAMVLVTFGGRSVGNIVIVLAVLYVPIFIRLTRSEVLTQSQELYVEAAQAMGKSELYIAIRHVLPNSLGPAITQASVTVGWAILLTAGISFVGAGLNPPTPEWGLMIASGASDIALGHWWPSVFPGAAVSIVVFGFALLGEEIAGLLGYADRPATPGIEIESEVD